jgi:hypothetical protein
MGTMAAVITDPLKARPKYKAARQVVQGVKDDKKQIIAEQGRSAYKAQLRTARNNAKSIKNKYSDKRSNVVEFDTQYMWDKVREILRADSQFNQMFDLMHQSNAGVKDILTATNQMAEMAANDQALLQQDAMRMSLLLGAPLPEKAAQSVVIGDNRFEYNPEDRGRRSLRIEQLPPSLAI